MPQAGKSFSNFSCPHCHAPISAPTVAVGTAVRCEVCHREVRVPQEHAATAQMQNTAPLTDSPEREIGLSESELDRVEAVESERGAPAEPSHDDNDYQLCEGVDQPPPGSRAYQTYIPVRCGKCETQMYGTIDQAGATLICPDCGSPAVVPPAAPPKEKSHPVRDVEGYDISAASPLATSDTKHVLNCPNCRADFEIVGLGDNVRVFCRYCGATFLHPAAAEDADVTVTRRGREEPRSWHYLFWPGVLDFPFYRGCLSRYVAMVLSGIVVCFIMMGAVALITTMVGALFGIFVLAAGSILSGIWLCWTSVVALRILEDTANSGDEIHNWPDMAFIDWYFDAFYIINAAVLSAVPGLLLSFVGRMTPGDYWLAIGASSFLCFPVILLSMEEANTVFQILSRPVLRSLFQKTRLWLCFYLATGLMIAASAIVLTLIAPMGLFYSVVGLFSLVVANMMIYFRMLGRLTWF